MCAMRLWRTRYWIARFQRACLPAIGELLAAFFERRGPFYTGFRDPDCGRTPHPNDDDDDEGLPRYGAR